MAFLISVWNLAVMILDDAGFQPMSDLTACGVSKKPAPSVRGLFAWSWPE